MTGKRDPRKSVRYANMVEFIDLLEENGPLNVEDSCDALGWTHDQFRDVRYSLPGRLAMADRDVDIPRPVCEEGYVYKLVTEYRSGNVEDDGEPDLLCSISDMLTRMCIISDDWDTLRLKISNGKVRKMMTKVSKGFGFTLAGLSDVADQTGAAVSDRASYILANQ